MPSSRAYPTSRSPARERIALDDDPRHWPAGSHTAGSTPAGTHAAAHIPARRISTETKASFKTTELVAYVAVAIAVLIAAAVVDVSDFGAQEAWFYVTLLTIGYMVSRGLAKSGSRDYFDDNADSNDNGR